MRKIMNVEELDVFKLAHRLVLEVYKVSKDFPREEVYGLASQIRRAASSATINLAEGANRNSKALNIESLRVLPKVRQVRFIISCYWQKIWDI